MKNLLTIARLHLVGAANYLLYPWLILGLNFFIANIIGSGTGGATHDYSGEVFSIYVAFIAIGVISVIRWFPFALALGVSRRSYYLGVSLVALAISAVDGLVLGVLQLVERGAGGWGSHLYFFRVPYIFPGPWYLTWLTSFVLLTACFVYGMWFGIVYRRWNLAGLVAFSTVQALVLIVGAWLATGTHAWHSIGHFFTSLSVEGLTALLAGLVALLLVGGLTTIRRATV